MKRLDVHVSVDDLDAGTLPRLLGRQPAEGSGQPARPAGASQFRSPERGMRSKGSEEFATLEAPVMDFVFTMRDSAAGEVCTIWSGQPMTAHLAIAGVDQTALGIKLREIGHMYGSTFGRPKAG